MLFHHLKAKRNGALHPRPSARAAIIALYLATVAVYADMYITQPILPLLSHEFGIAPAIAGLSISVLVFVISVASSSYGPISDSFGRKTVMVWSCALLTVPTLLCVWTPTFSALLIARAAQGLLIPGVTAVAVAYLGDRWKEAELGAVVGGFISASVAGGLLGRVMSGVVTELVNWRATFAVFALLTFGGALGMARFLPNDGSMERTGWISAYRGMVSHLGNRQLAGAFVIGGTLFFAYIAVFTYLPYYLSGAPFHLRTGLVSSVYVVYLAGVLVAPVAGRLSQRIARQTIMAVGLVVAACGAAGTLLGRLPIIVIALIVLVLGNFIAQSTAPAFVNATAPRAKGGASALYLAFYYAGATLGSFVPGFAWQAWGWKGVVGMSVASLAIGLAADIVLCRTPAPLVA